jgi:mannose-6-phosphate isomerase class I
MDISRIEDMKGGWFIGNFEPSAWKTDAFEVAVHDYKKGEEKEPQYHKLGTEIILLLEGNISKWWANRTYKVAHGEGLFIHLDEGKHGRQN